MSKNKSLRHELSSGNDEYIINFYRIDSRKIGIIQLALESDIAWVCLDDLRGRKVAKRHGLQVIGLLGVLAWAKELGIIPRLRPYAEKLVAEGGRYSPRLIAGILATVGE